MMRGGNVTSKGVGVMQLRTYSLGVSNGVTLGVPLNIVIGDTPLMTRAGSAGLNSRALKYPTLPTAAGMKVVMDERGVYTFRYTTRKARLEALQAYGGRCVCCGEDNEAFLAFDHIAGRASDDKLRGPSLAAKLRQLGYPKDNIQILCHNCNSAKGVGLTCPCAGGTIKRTVEDELNSLPPDGRVRYGEAHHNAKLSNDEAEEVRQLWSEGWTQKSLAERYASHYSTISRIVNGSRRLRQRG